MFDFRVWLLLLMVLAGGIDLTAAEQKKVVVCSTTQVADFARVVVGDRMEVKCILAPGQDPHSYLPTIDDARLVEKADLCLENGWHLEGKDWMRTLAKNAGKPIVACVEGVEPLRQADGNGETNDPHAWFSPRNASQYVRNVLAAVSKIEPEHEREFRARAELYIQELGTLHTWIQKQVNQVPVVRRKLITNHDAFGYFCREYGFAGITPVGWSTTDEVGAGATLTRRQSVIETLRAAKIPTIFVETTINPEMMQQIAEETGVKIGGELYSDAMGAADTAGASYIGMMRENVLLIVEGLR